MEKAIKRYSPVFVLPTLLAFMIGFIIPFIQGLYLSFCQFTTVNNATFTGLSNYQGALADSSFLSSFKNIGISIIKCKLLYPFGFGFFM